MQAEIKSKIVAINPVIEFDCVVNGRELTATLTQTEDDFVQTLYHVRFSDGHEDRYAPGDTGVDEKFGRTMTLDPYEEAIWDDLAVIPGLEDGGGYTYIRVYLKKDNSGFNVWAPWG